MPKEMLEKYLAEDGDYLRLQLVMQSAPLLKGVKISCVLVMEKTKLQDVFEEFKNTDIEYAVFHEMESKIMVLFYRRKELEHYLGRSQIQLFLSQFGYKGNSIEEHLPLLRERVSVFYKKKDTFPHEIGVFLGYPIEDVTGFIEHAGKNFLFCGYWKVYSNIQRAKEIFQKCDEAKDVAAKELFAGKKLCEIVG